MHIVAGIDPCYFCDKNGYDDFRRNQVDRELLL